MSPAAALILLAAAWAIVLALGARRERRHRRAQARLVALRERYGIYDATEGHDRG